MRLGFACRRADRLRGTAAGGALTAVALGPSADIEPNESLRNLAATDRDCAGRRTNGNGVHARGCARMGVIAPSELALAASSNFTLRRGLRASSSSSSSSSSPAELRARFNVLRSTAREIGVNSWAGVGVDMGGKVFKLKGVLELPCELRP